MTVREFATSSKAFGKVYSFPAAVRARRLCISCDRPPWRASAGSAGKRMNDRNAFARSELKAVLRLELFQNGTVYATNLDEIVDAGKWLS